MALQTQAQMEMYYVVSLSLEQRFYCAWTPDSVLSLQQDANNAIKTECSKTTHLSDVLCSVSAKSPDCGSRLWEAILR